MTTYIYKFTSPSGKVYIGLTSSDIDKRWKQHVTLWKKLKRNNIEYRGASATSILFYAFDKYDPSLWEKEVLIETDDIQYAKEQEIKLIEWYQATNPDFGYNVLIGGQTGWAGKNLSKDHKEKQSNARKEWFKTQNGQAWKEELSKKWKENNPIEDGHPFKGKHHTQEAKHKIGEKNKGRLLGITRDFSQEHCDNISKGKMGKPLSPEHREKIVAAMTGRKQPESQKKAVTEANSLQWLVTLPTGEQKEITNLRQFCKDNKLSQGSLTTYGHSKGYKVQKLEN